MENQKRSGVRRPLPGWRRFLPGLALACLMMTAAISGCSNGPGPWSRLQARIQLKKGNEHYLAGHFEQAIKNYDAALGFSPLLATACLNRAYSQEALFRGAEDPQRRQALASDAVSSFDVYLNMLAQGAHAGEDAPGRARIEDRVISLLVDSQQVGKAIARLKARYERDPHDVSALTLLSRLDLERGNLDEALEWQRKRVAAAPDDPDAQYSFGAFVWLLSYRDKEMDPARREALLDEGMAALQKALALRPNDFQTMIYINLLYIEKSTYAETNAQKAEFAATAKSYRDRALALRKAAQDTTALAAGDTTATAAPHAVMPAAPDSASRAGG